MLSINSSVHEIEEAHKTMSMKQVAKQVGIGEVKLRKILQYAGYEYDSSKRKWCYVLIDETKDCRNLSLWSIMERINGNIGNMDVTASQQQKQQQEGNTGNMKITDKEVEVTEVAQQVAEGNMSNTGNNEVAEFTQEEIKVLKQLAQQHMATGTSVNVSSGSHSIIQAIQSVPTGSTNKKTFVIQDSVIEQLDAFCDSHRIKKSDFLAVAILEALSKYS